MNEESSAVLKDLIMQTMDNVRELTKQISEVKTLLRSTVESNNDINRLLVERVNRHRLEINELKDAIKEINYSKIDPEEYENLKNTVEDLQQSKNNTMKILTGLCSTVGAIVTSMVIMFIEKYLLR